jgi:type VI protein secretion system component VasK
MQPTHVLDSWARCVGDIKKGLDFNLDLSMIKDESNNSKTGIRSSSRIQPIDSKGKLDAAAEAVLETKRNLAIWKEKAKQFILFTQEEEMPIAVPLKQAIERPPTAEQKMRSLKEQQMVKEKLKEKEEKMKNDALNRDKKALKAKGPINYDYEGNFFEIKPQKLNEKNNTLITSIP